MFFFSGSTYCTSVYFFLFSWHLNSFSLIGKEAEGSITSTHTQTTLQTKSLIHQSTPSAAPVCEPAGYTGCVCQDFPEFISNCAEQMAHCDMAEWFYEAPPRSHRHCDQLCLPPAIGQGSYNRRLGGRGRGPRRTLRS